jgi:hypothetical protein
MKLKCFTCLPTRIQELYTPSFPIRKNIIPNAVASLLKAKYQHSYDFPKALMTSWFLTKIYNGITAYSVLIRRIFAKKKDKLIVQKHDAQSEVIEQYNIAYREFEKFEKFEREDMYALQYGDLRDFEQIINQVDCGTK